MKKGRQYSLKASLNLTRGKDGEKRSKMRVTARSIQFLSLTNKKDASADAPERHKNHQRTPR